MIELDISFFSSFMKSMVWSIHDRLIYMYFSKFNPVKDIGAKLKLVSGNRAIKAALLEGLPYAKLLIMSDYIYINVIVIYKCQGLSMYP